ncbi:SpoIID/LytB domain-containing protein [Defluviitalea phaphyphila]|uniref:SpoIID/LytB domain-containing protein n=1 Tax=Defluviitalea phaphyphila TaxID=1473580 RepID=UPI000730F41F|nr:SpoIID/LytB domain-containing protein [Defluviitalea phaphyphila]
MNNIKMYKIIIIFVIFILIFSGCTQIMGKNETTKENINLNNKNISLDEDNSSNIFQSPNYELNYVEADIPVSRALAAKMIALTYNDLSDIKTMDREIEYKDVNPNDWYYVYVNAVTIQGFMNGEGENFNPLEPLTYSQAQILLERVAKGKYNIKMNLKEEEQKKYISYKDWVNIYIQLINKLSEENGIEKSYGIRERNIVLVATPANSTELDAWKLGTDKGIYGFAGLSMDSYIDKEIKVLLKDNEIFAFIKVENDSPIMTNIYIDDINNDELTIFVGGVHRTYKINSDFSDKKGKIADIKIGEGEILSLTSYEEAITGRILLTDSKKIEIEGKGNIPLAEDYKLYDISGENIKWSSLSNLILGEDIAKFILKDNKICAGIIEKKPIPSKIRVALNKTGFSGLIHSNVEITSDEDFIVKLGAEEQLFKAGEVFSIQKINEKLSDENPRVEIKTKSGNGKLKVLSIQRNGENPKYRGNLYIVKLENGYSIINELPIEEYLYAVIPSEMPTSYGLEPAKVQAVTARSYAYVQFYSNRFHAYGGNVDDSVKCQVYNNIPENDISIKAVNATQNEGLTYNGNVISANFFSTSCGYTANSGEVWADYVDKSFPSYTPPYMVSKKQFEGEDFGDLTKEENAAKFFKTTNIDSYDKDFGWFRWNVSMTLEELSASINANLKERYEANPKLIKTLDENNIFRSRFIENIGNLKKIDIVKRGQGGNIMEIVLIGSKATIKVLTEYNIRFLLQPKQHIKGEKQIIINLHNGTKIADYNLMPSAFFVAEPNKDDSGQIIGYTFYGGGNGHGAGMSQNGVKGMVDKGYNYKEILKHYYNGTEIKKIY